MKSILIVNNVITGGGAEVVMQNLIAYLHKRYKITVMTFNNDIEAFKRFCPNDVKYRVYSVLNNRYSRQNPLHYAIRLYNRLVQFSIKFKKYNIVIANKEGPCMELASKIRADSKFAWVHVDYRYLYWTKAIFKSNEEVQCMKKFNKVVCVSKATAESVKNVIGDPGNLTVCYNPINYMQIEEKSKNDIDIQKPLEKLLFVAVGRIAEQKNFKSLVRVCSKLSREFDFELWIVGDGPQRREIEVILERESCSCVKLLGKKENPYPYIAKADVLVSTALCESYGLAIQEALILGVPVITTKCEAIEECFDERFGIMIERNDLAIEQGLRSILENPKIVVDYKDNIREKYVKTELWEERLRIIGNIIQ